MMSYSFDLRESSQDHFYNQVGFSNIKDLIKVLANNIYPDRHW